MSLWWRSDPSENSICDSINSYTKNWWVVVSSSWNSNIDTSSFVPWWCSETITVGAIDQINSRASFSNYWAKVDVSAPWVWIYSTQLNNGYKEMNWTSMATPHITWLVSIIITYKPNLKTQEIKQILKQNSTQLNSESSKPIWWGVDVESLIASLKNEVTEEVPLEEVAEGETEEKSKTALYDKILLESEIDLDLKLSDKQENISPDKLKNENQEALLEIESTWPKAQKIEFWEIKKLNIEISSDNNNETQIEEIDIEEIEETKKQNYGEVPRVQSFDENWNLIEDEVKINSLEKEVYTPWNWKEVWANFDIYNLPEDSFSSDESIDSNEEENINEEEDENSEIKEVFLNWAKKWVDINSVSETNWKNLELKKYEDTEDFFDEEWNKVNLWDLEKVEAKKEVINYNYDKEIYIDWAKKWVDINSAWNEAGKLIEIKEYNPEEGNDNIIEWKVIWDYIEEDDVEWEDEKIKINSLGEWIWIQNFSSSWWWVQVQNIQQEEIFIQSSYEPLPEKTFYDYEFKWENFSSVKLYIKWTDKQVFKPWVSWSFAANMWWSNHGLKAYFNGNWHYYEDIHWTPNKRVHHNFYSDWYKKWIAYRWYKNFSNGLKLNDNYNNNMWYNNWHDDKHGCHWGWCNYNPFWVRLQYKASKNYYCDESDNEWKDENGNKMWIWCKAHFKPIKVANVIAPELTNSNSEQYPIEVTLESFNSDWASSMQLYYTLDDFKTTESCSQSSTELKQVCVVNMTWKWKNDLKIIPYLTSDKDNGTNDAHLNWWVHPNIANYIVLWEEKVVNNEEEVDLSIKKLKSSQTKINLENQNGINFILNDVHYLDNKQLTYSYSFDEENYIKLPNEKLKKLSEESWVEINSLSGTWYTYETHPEDEKYKLQENIWIQNTVVPIKTNEIHHKFWTLTDSNTYDWYTWYKWTKYWLDSTHRWILWENYIEAKTIDNHIHLYTKDRYNYSVSETPTRFYGKFKVGLHWTSRWWNQSWYINISSEDNKSIIWMSITSYQRNSVIYHKNNNKDTLCWINIHQDEVECVNSWFEEWNYIVLYYKKVNWKYSKTNYKLPDDLSWEYTVEFDVNFKDKNYTTKFIDVNGNISEEIEVDFSSLSDFKDIDFSNFKYFVWAGTTNYVNQKTYPYEIWIDFEQEENQEIVASLENTPIIESFKSTESTVTKDNQDKVEFNIDKVSYLDDKEYLTYSYSLDWENYVELSKEKVENTQQWLEINSVSLENSSDYETFSEEDILWIKQLETEPEEFTYIDNGEKSTYTNENQEKTFSIQSDNIIFSDDMSDWQLDSFYETNSNWRSQEENWYIQSTMVVTDQDSTLHSQWFDMWENWIDFEYDFYSHPAWDYFYGGMHLFMEWDSWEDEYFYKAMHYYTKYYSWWYKPLKNNIEVYARPNWDDSYRRFVEIPWIHNSWVNHRIKIDINNNKIIHTINWVPYETEMDLSNLKNRKIKFRISPYWWWTWHYTRVDNITIEKLEAEKKVELKQTSYKFDLDLSSSEDGEIIVYTKVNDWEKDSNILSVKLDKKTETEQEETSFTEEEKPVLKKASYSFDLNLSDRRDGSVAIYAKANDGEKDSNIVSLVLQKDTNPIKKPTSFLTTKTEHDYVSYSWEDTNSWEYNEEKYVLKDENNNIIVDNIWKDTINYKETWLTQLTSYQRKLCAVNNSYQEKCSDLIRLTTSKTPTIINLELFNGQTLSNSMYKARYHDFTFSKQWLIDLSADSSNIYITWKEVWELQIEAYHNWTYGHHRYLINVKIIPKLELVEHNIELFVWQYTIIYIPEEIENYDLEVSNPSIFVKDWGSLASYSDNSFRINPYSHGESKIVLREKTWNRLEKYIINVKVNISEDDFTMIESEKRDPWLNSADEHSSDNNSVAYMDWDEIVAVSPWKARIKTSRDGIIKGFTNVTVLPIPKPKLVECITTVWGSCYLDINSSSYSWYYYYDSNWDYGYESNWLNPITELWNISIWRHGSLWIRPERTGETSIYVRAKYGNYITHIFKVIARTNSIKYLSCEAPKWVVCETNWLWDDKEFTYRVSDSSILDLSTYRYISWSHIYENLRIKWKKVWEAEVYVYENWEHVATFNIKVLEEVPGIIIDKRFFNVWKGDIIQLKIIDWWWDYEVDEYDEEIIEFRVYNSAKQDSEEEKIWKVMIVWLSTWNTYPRLRDKWWQTATISVRVNDENLKISDLGTFNTETNQKELQLSPGQAYTYIYSIDVEATDKRLKRAIRNNDNVGIGGATLNHGGELQYNIMIFSKADTPWVTLIKFEDHQGNFEDVIVRVVEPNYGYNNTSEDESEESNNEWENESLPTFEKLWYTKEIEKDFVWWIAFKITWEVDEVWIEYINKDWVNKKKILKIREDWEYIVWFTKESCSECNNFKPYFKLDDNISYYEQELLVWYDSLNLANVQDWVEINSYWYWGFLKDLNFVWKWKRYDEKVVEIKQELYDMKEDYWEWASLAVSLFPWVWEWYDVWTLLLWKDPITWEKLDNLWKVLTVAWLLSWFASWKAVRSLAKIWFEGLARKLWMSLDEIMEVAREVAKGYKIESLGDLKALKDKLSVNKFLKEVKLKAITLKISKVGLKLSNANLQHIKNRHLVGWVQFKPWETSYFNNDNITELINNFEVKAIKEAKFWNFSVTKVFDEYIWYDKSAWVQTKTMSIIFDELWNIITAHPGLPTK